MKKLFTYSYLVISALCLAATTILWLDAKGTYEKSNKCHADNVSAEVVKDFKSVESVDFEMDMEKMEVVLIKRSICDGNEVTLVELADGKTHSIACSRDRHDRLVEKFRRILLKRNNGF